MTRAEFERQAIRDAQRDLGVPPGSSWYGTYSDFRNSGRFRIRYSAPFWVLSRAGKHISNHDMRSGALAAAWKLWAR